MVQYGNVRFGSKADMCNAHRHVRFTPNSGHMRCKEECPLSAKSGLMQRSAVRCQTRSWCYPGVAPLRSELDAFTMNQKILSKSDAWQRSPKTLGPGHQIIDLASVDLHPGATDFSRRTVSRFTSICLEGLELHYVTSKLHRGFWVSQFFGMKKTECRGSMVTRG